MGAEDQPTHAAVETMAHEQFRFRTQIEECHRHRITGQMEVERRIVELEAWVATLWNELVVQWQKMQA